MKETACSEGQWHDSQRNIPEKQYKRINEDAQGLESLIFVCSTVSRFQI